MAFIQKDRVRESSTSTGVGDFTLAGAQAGYQSFSSVMSIGDTCVYAIILPGGGWETGIGTYSAANTLSRTTVKESSNAGSLVVFAAGSKDVMIGPNASQSISPAGAQLFSAAEKSQIQANVGQHPENKASNSGVMVSQRNGTVAGNPMSGVPYWPVDRFQCFGSNSGVATVAQVASVTPGGSPNRIRVTVTTADATVAATDYLLIRQPLEGLKVVDFRLGSASAKTAVLTFGISAPAGVYGAFIQNYAQTRSYAAEITIAPGEANTVVSKTVVVNLDQAGTWITSNAGALYFGICLMGGTSWQLSANTWSAANGFCTSNQFNFMGTNGNVFELFDVDFFEGTAPRQYQLPNFVKELDSCLWYWEKTYDYGTMAGTGTAYAGATQISLNLASGTFSNSSGQGMGFQYQKPKRVAPTVTAYSPQTGASGKVTDFSGGGDVTAGVFNPGTQGIRVWTASPITAGGTLSLAVHFTIDADL